MEQPDTGEVERILGPKPHSGKQRPERFPGGTDSLEDEDKYGEIPADPLAADTPAQANPATSAAPDEVAQGEDKKQEPDEDPDDPARAAGASRDTDAGATDRQGDKDADLASDPDSDPDSDLDSDTASGSGDAVDTADEPGA